MFGRKDPLKALEAQLLDLARRKEALESRLAAATAEIETAQAERRRILIEDDEAKNLAKAEAALRDAESRRAGLADALREIARRIEDTDKQLVEARDRAERERVAAILSGDAAAVETASAELHDAVKAVGKAFAKLAASAAHRPAVNLSSGGSARPETFAALVLADALAAEIPAAFREIRVTGGALQAGLMRGAIAGRALRFDVEGAFPAPSDAKQAAQAVIAEPMRRLAAAIRAGEADAVLPEPAPEPEPAFIPRYGLVDLLALRPFRFHDRATVPVIVPVGRSNQPEPVARLAIQRGLALDMATPEGQRGFAEWQAKRAKSGNIAPVSASWSECADLDFILDDWRAQEIERLRAEWRLAKAA